VNSVCLVGRLGASPTLRYTPQGTAVANFSIAVDAGKDKPADWFDIVVWQKQAENVAESVRKGHRVAVSGRLQTRTYEGKDGNKRKVVEVVASWVDFLEPKSNAGAPSGGGARPPEEEPDESDVPF